MSGLILFVIYLLVVCRGFPESLLGSAWPGIYTDLEISSSLVGFITVTVSSGKVAANILNDRLIRRFGTGRLMLLSVSLMALSMLGFSFSKAFWMFVVMAIPCGLAMGSMDVSLNSYVALHYKNRHISWMNCMWGIGSALSPYIMSFSLASGSWRYGYRYIAALLALSAAIVLISQPLWRKKEESPSKKPAERSDLSAKEKSRSDGRKAASEAGLKSLILFQTLKIRGVKEILVCFFCYGALEQTPILWMSSYLVFKEGMTAAQAAGYVSLFSTGIMAGRALSGLISIKKDDMQIIRMGMAMLAVGITVMVLSGNTYISLAAFFMLGLGCAPVYPCFIHLVPQRFGREGSRRIIGAQMACAALGASLMPSLYGLIAQIMTQAVMPFYLLIFLIIMALMYRMLRR